MLDTDYSWIYLGNLNNYYKMGKNNYLNYNTTHKRHGRVWLSHVLESALKYPRPTLPPYMSPIEPQSSAEPIFAIIMTASVVMAGILINYTIKRIRKWKLTVIDKDFKQYLQTSHENLLNKQRFRRDSLLVNHGHHPVHSYCGFKPLSIYRKNSVCYNQVSLFVG